MVSTTVFSLEVHSSTISNHTLQVKIFNTRGNNPLKYRGCLFCVSEMIDVLKKMQEKLVEKSSKQSVKIQSWKIPNFLHTNIDNMTH